MLDSKTNRMVDMKASAVIAATMTMNLISYVQTFGDILFLAVCIDALYVTVSACRLSVVVIVLVKISVSNYRVSWQESG